MRVVERVDRRRRASQNAVGGLRLTAHDRRPSPSLRFSCTRCAMRSSRPGCRSKARTGQHDRDRASRCWRRRSPMRSRSFDAFIAAMMTRRSLAIGCRSASDASRTRPPRSRAPDCIDLHVALHHLGGELRVAAHQGARRIGRAWRSDRPPISGGHVAQLAQVLVVAAYDVLIATSSYPSVLLPLRTSAEAAGDVVLRLACFVRGEHLRRRSHRPRSARRDRRRPPGPAHARRLLHVVRDDDDGEVALELRRAGPRSCRVEIGSSAEVGSSNRITSGRTAMVRAMHRRCCWPPDRPRAELVEPVLDLVPDRRARSAPSTRSSSWDFDSFS
jgi:hypothetical protein